MNQLIKQYLQNIDQELNCFQTFLSVGQYTLDSALQNIAKYVFQLVALIQNQPQHITDILQNFYKQLKELQNIVQQMQFEHDQIKRTILNAQSNVEQTFDQYYDQQYYDQQFDYTIFHLQRLAETSYSMLSCLMLELEESFYGTGIPMTSIVQNQ